MNATETAQRWQLKFFLSLAWLAGPYKEVAETEVSSETVFLLAAQAGDCWWPQAVSYDLQTHSNTCYLEEKKKTLQL